MKKKPNQIQKKSLKVPFNVLDYIWLLVPDNQLLEHQDKIFESFVKNVLL